MENVNEKIFKGSIYWAKLEEREDKNIQHGTRPVLVVSNDKCNEYSNIIHVIPITTKSKRNLPTHIDLNEFQAASVGLPRESTIMAEGMMSIDKRRLQSKIGQITDKKLIANIDDIIDIQLGRTPMSFVFSKISWMLKKHGIDDGGYVNTIFAR